jgi:hypothetical protein
MGFKLRGFVRCGRCGKSRGIRHLCVSSRASRRRHKVQSPVTRECSTCGKPRGFRHTCVVRTDFKQRKRAAARHRATEERRRKRQLTAAKRKLRRQLMAADRRSAAKARQRMAGTKTRTRTTPRLGGGSHEPGTCGDRDCPKYGCKAYFEGFEEGQGSGFDAGYAAAQADGG